MANQIEAEIVTPSGTKIRVKGAAKEVQEILNSFASSAPPIPIPSFGSSLLAGNTSAQTVANQVGNLDGIAEKLGEGDVHMIVGDLKAGSAYEAAARLIYLTLLARKKLLGEEKTSRELLNKTLKSYNLYDGNTRNIFPREKAFVKYGRKFVSLSNAALATAWEYAKDVQDPSVVGKWRPDGGRSRKRKVVTK